MDTNAAGNAKPIRVVYPQPAQAPAEPIAQSAATPDPAPVAPAAPVQTVAAVDPQVSVTAQQPTPQSDIDAVLRATAKIDLNTASVEELDRIPGGGRIGRAIARHRPYESVEDLLRKHVLRRSVYERIRDEVAVR